MENVHDLIQYFVGGTACTEAEAQLSQQLKRIMNWMPGGFFIYRADGDEELLYANEAVLQIFLCDTMEEFRALTGNSFRGIVHPDDLDAVEESIQVQISASQADLDYVEYRIIRKDGSVRWVDDYGHFIHSDGGDVFCVFIGDNTEEKLVRIQREKNLQSRMEAYHQELNGISEEYLRRLEVIEGLSADYESIFYIDLDANTIQSYQLSRHLEGAFDPDQRTRELDSFVEEYAQTWVHPDDRQPFRDFLSPEHLRSELTGHRICDMDYRILRGGTEVYFQLHAVGAGERRQSGQVILGARSVDALIRRNMKQREVLESALHQANSAMVAKNTFLSNMSHDMRTPMNAILGFTALARRHLDDGARTEGYLDIIETAGNQLLKLVNEVLEIARMESGKTQLKEDACDLCLTAEAAVRLYAEQAKDKRVTLELHTEGVRQPLIYSDGERLEQVLAIFVDNAIKYTPAGGWVRVDVEELKNSDIGYGTYRMAVADNGVGISADFRERIFLPFERQKNTTIGKVPGTGLGLSIAKGIVEAMGGTVDVVSTPGAGSTFSVTLTFREQENTPLPEPAEQSPPCLGFGKILLVEDNDLNLEIERDLLEEEGYTVDTAEDGSVALEMIKRSRPGEYAVILMDIQMPVMDGYQATEAIRSLGDPALARIPIVAVSANAFDEDKRRSSACGMNGHIPKPVDIPRLLSAIRAYTRLDGTAQK